MKTLNVTGNAKINVKSTITRLSIKLTSICELFNEVVAKSAEDTGKMKDIVESLGFKRSDLKTVSFDVEAKYNYVYDDKGNNKEEFKGYEYIHYVSIEFPIDNKILGDLLYAFSKSGIEPRFKIGYTVEEEEKEKYRDILIKESIKNAKKRAKILAKASGLELNKIYRIDYLEKSIDMYEDYYNVSSKAMAMEQEGTYNFDIDVADLILSDSVNVTWKIK